MISVGAQSWLFLVTWAVVFAGLLTVFLTRVSETFQQVAAIFGRGVWLVLCTTSALILSLGLTFPISYLIHLGINGFTAPP